VNDNGRRGDVGCETTMEWQLSDVPTNWPLVIHEEFDGGFGSLQMV
jgi:hypothetical protein